MEKYQKSHKNNKFKILSPTWNDKFELPGGSYSLSYAQDYTEYFIKKHEMLTYNPPMKTFFKRIENRITFKTKSGYHL